MNNHLIKGNTREISAYTFMFYPCFMIIDHEMKENQPITTRLSRSLVRQR